MSRLASAPIAQLSPSGEESFFLQIIEDVRSAMDIVSAQVADAWQERISIDVEYVTGPRGGIVTIRSQRGESPRRDTHNLYDSIQSYVESDSGQVTGTVDTDVFYAPILEDRMDRPHFQVTFDEWADQVIDAVVESVEHPASA